MEELLPIIVALAYLFISFLGRFVRGNKPADEFEPQPTSVEDMLKEMMGEENLSQEEQALKRPPPGEPYRGEARVPGEHIPTASEHRPTASEHRPTASERRPTFSEHHQAMFEIRPTRSEQIRTASEHRPTPGEHMKGDVELSSIFKLPPASTGGRRSPFAAEILTDLRGRKSLARVFLLREILGPPVSLRSPDDLSR